MEPGSATATMPHTAGRLAATGAVALAATAAALAGLDARATYGARVSADEPQYLLTAISLGEDVSLDISDELAANRYRPFHEVDLDPQTIALDDDGRRVSPHDPLLPALLAVPMRIGGWVGAKVFLALCAGAVAALTLRLAVDRFAASPAPAALVVAGFGAAPPLSAYGAQIYPAMPAAAAVLVGLLAATADEGRRVRGRGSPGTSSAGFVDWPSIVTAGAVIALPWLAVKYVPLAAVIAVTDLWRRRRRDGRVPTKTVATYIVAGIAYLALHRVFYGGWTVYAAGDHFVDGEWRVVGVDPDYWGRSRRLLGLLIDRGFGLMAWNPAYLALGPALVGLARSNLPDRRVALALVGAGWGTATWIALTMHGWWWPGRQVVPVLPIAVAAVAALVGTRARLLIAVLSACAIGVGTWLWLAWETSTGRRALIVDFTETANPWYRLWRVALPDHRRMDPVDVALTAGWAVAVVALCLQVARDGRRVGADESHVTTGLPSDPCESCQESLSLPE